ncbi:DNA helicase [Tanacetum coccineum]
MSDIDCTNPNDDQISGQQRFNFMRLHNSNTTGDTLAFQESGDSRELTRADVQTVSIRGNVRSRLSTETHDMLDTTTVPLSMVFDCFRNMWWNGFEVRLHVPRRLVLLAVNIECDRKPIEDQEIRTTVVGNAGYYTFYSPFLLYLAMYTLVTNQCSNVDFVYFLLCTSPIIHQISFTRVDEGGFVRTNPLITASLEESFYPHAICVVGHAALSSIIAPVNHAYLCLNVTDCVIRPEIIPFPTNRLENAYQSHARGENSDTTVSAANECSTPRTQQTVESGRLQTAMSEVSSSSRHTPRRSSIHGGTPSYIDLGDCNQQCRHCGCLFWYNERLKNNNYGRRAEYHLCCGGGKIYMPSTPDHPLFIQHILRNSHFMKHIRAYNQMFTMTSFRAKVDNSVNRGRGPYVFKVSGQIYHWIGSLCPEEDHHPRFLQLYIYDTHAEVANRKRNFGRQNNDTLNPEIVEGLIHVFDEHNGFVRLFRTARDRCNAGEIPNFKIRLYNKGGARGYELPTFNILGGIVFEDGPKSQTDFDYVVAAFCAIEQSRLDFIRKRQNDLRSDYLLGLTPTDRADIVCRVFEQKVNDFINFLKYERPFGYVIACMFQKRGLPHCHTLLWVDSSSKIRDAAQIDKYISAELPDPVEDPKGYKVVSKLMMHGPCGVANPSASCTEKGIYNKHFPKMYNDKTFFDTNGHTHYQRRQTQVHVMKGESRLDNCNKVPYNRMLCLAFRAHVIFEYCGWSMLIKYLFKYISKGPDRILGKIDRPIEDASTSTGERHIQYPIHRREPVVQILNVHLENMQRVNFHERDRLDVIVNMPDKKKTTLTEWYVYNNEHTDGRHLTYLDFPSEFVWYLDTKSWHRRVVRTKKSLGRRTYIHPNSNDLFYFRMLLCHQKGCKSPIEVRTVNGQVLPTYRAAYEALGLLGDDREWDIALEESAVSASSAQLRTLFAQILIYYDDEAPMNDRHCFEALDRTLRDLMNAPETLFGGKIVVLGGDFRQTLLVKKGATKEDLIHASIVESYLRVIFKICTLKQNMRLLRYALGDEERERSKVFAKWLLDVGNGEVDKPDKDNNEDTVWITALQQHCINPSEQALSELIDFIYDDATLKHQLQVLSRKKQ